MKKGMVVLFLFYFLIIGNWTILWAKENVEDANKGTLLPTYRSFKVDNNSIQIDGRLDEFVWKDKPVMKFREIKEGTPPIYQSVTIIVWDDSYLYVGMEIEEPDVWGRWGVKDSEVEKQKDRYVVFDASQEKGWGRVESKIMSTDPFVKIFIDPDGDGKNYLEFHINTINNMYDTYVEYGFKERWGDTGPLPLHIEWQCQGFKSAVQVYGTLNYPEDTDQGWSIEVAIPWESTREFTKGNCPPKPGDSWKAHLGRVYRKEYRSKRHYWTWPVIGQINCHLLGRYGKIIFCDLKK